MPAEPSSSLAAVGRLFGRLLVVWALWAFWPRVSRGDAAAVLCVCLAAGCAVAAVLQGEPMVSTELNRWFEALILFVVAAFILVLS
jgi:hypothetical protein